MTPIELIKAERARQISAEGWTPEHDDLHDGGQMGSAAACYAMPRNLRTYLGRWFSRLWPWDIRFWKPTPDDRLKELAKAGALIVAEMERLQRLAHQISLEERLGNPRVEDR